MPGFVEIEVGKHRLKIEKFSTAHGMQVLAKLINICGKAIQKAAGESVKDIKIAMILVYLTTDVEPKDLEWFMTELKNKTTVNMAGGWVDMNDGVFETVFDGAYEEVFKWLGKGLEINFQRFLDSIGLSLSGAVPPKPSE